MFHIVLIYGFGGTENSWPKDFILLLEKIYIIHRVKVVKNIKNIFYRKSIYEMAIEIKKYIIKKNIKPDVLGYSMGGFVLQELAKMQNKKFKLNKLIFLNSACEFNIKRAEKYILRNDIRYFFPKKWIKNNKKKVAKLEYNFRKNTSIFHLIFQMIIIKNWNSNCKSLKIIKNKSIIITGDKDKIITAFESISMEKYLINNIKTVIIKNSGHGLLFQYPKMISNIIIKN